MHNFEHKEFLEEKLNKELKLTKPQAKFVKELAVSEDGGYVSEHIAKEFIKKYGNKFKLSIKSGYSGCYTVFDDMVIFGEILKKKGMVRLKEDWNYCKDNEDYTDDACVKDPMTFDPGDRYSQMGY